MITKPRLNSVYYFLRPFIPRRWRWFFHRKRAKRIDGFSTVPMWPLPEISKHADKVAWPEGKTTAFILTHDVDTKFGFENIKNVSEVEKALDLRGSWNIVPHLYEVESSVLDYLRDSGLEVGVHDWNHDGRLFSTREVFEERVGEINRVIREWKAKGFRAGAVFHHDSWMQKFECLYDSSFYDTDPFQPMAGGCKTIWPFMLGNLVELPYTMPQDHVLFVAGMELMVPKVCPPHLDSQERKRNYYWMHGWCERSIPNSGAEYWVIGGVDLWRMKTQWLVENGGMVLMLVHPEYLCHPRIRLRRKGKGFQDALRSNTGWMPGSDEDIISVREKGIIGEKFFGSLLEQYAAFLHWFKRKYGKKTWHCLPKEMAERYKNGSLPHKKEEYLV